MGILNKLGFFIKGKSPTVVVDCTSDNTIIIKHKNSIHNMDFIKSKSSRVSLQIGATFPIAESSTYTTKDKINKMAIMKREYSMNIRVYRFPRESEVCRHVLMGKRVSHCARIAVGPDLFRSNNSSCSYDPHSKKLYFEER